MWLLDVNAIISIMHKVILTYVYLLEIIDTSPALTKSSCCHFLRCCLKQDL